MSPLATAILPTFPPISPSIISTLTAFYTHIDQHDASSGPGLANHVFTPDGIWQSPNPRFEGRAQLMAYKPEAYGVARFRHEVYEVYARDGEGRDLMHHGRMEMRTLDGVEKFVDFAARAVFVVGEDGEARIRYFQGYLGRSEVR